MVTDSSATGFSSAQLPKPSDDLPWMREELAECFARRIYGEIPASQAASLNKKGFSISNAFVVHSAGKRRLVVNLKRQSTFFRPTPVTMETLESFVLQLNHH